MLALLLCGDLIECTAATGPGIQPAAAGGSEAVPPPIPAPSLKWPKGSPGRRKAFNLTPTERAALVSIVEELRSRLPQGRLRPAQPAEQGLLA